MDSKDLTPVTNEEPLVSRSSVTPGLSYLEYKQTLRYDFFYQCAYCTTSEAEAAAYRFTIDHYHPKSDNLPNADIYSNLMWCCDICNTYKGSKIQPATAANEGHRFFRPDADSFLVNFRLEGLRVEGNTNIGRYTVVFLSLNRAYLLRVRQLRQRLFTAAEDVARGMRAVRKLPIDRLPARLKGPAYRAIQDILSTEEAIAADIDRALAENVKSHALDEDPDAETARKERLQEQKRLRTLHPGRWRTEESEP